MRGLKFSLDVGKPGINGSHPSRVRGLKYEPRPQRFLSGKVAPFAGAWIEIKVLLNGIYGIPSHPSRVRGLKFYNTY